MSVILESDILDAYAYGDINEYDVIDLYMEGYISDNTMELMIDSDYYISEAADYCLYEDDSDAYQKRLKKMAGPDDSSKYGNWLRKNAVVNDDSDAYRKKLRGMAGPDDSSSYRKKLIAMARR